MHVQIARVITSKQVERVKMKWKTGGKINQKKIERKVGKKGGVKSKRNGKNIKRRNLPKYISVILKVVLTLQYKTKIIRIDSFLT